MPGKQQDTVLAAIDVGTNAVRLELARPGPDGSLEVLHTERDPVRPGEGVFKTGMISEEVAERLLSTLRRYAALCRRHKALVRAVATSAVREAKNKDDIVRRAREEAGMTLEVVSGKEEARLICMGVLHGKPPLSRSVCIDIGGGSTEVAIAVGEKPQQLWSVALGAVRLTEVFDASGRIPDKQLSLMREYADESLQEGLPDTLPTGFRTALGSSGTIQAVVSYAAAEGTAHATLRQISRAVEELVAMGPEGRRKHFDSKRADIIVAGAVILESATKCLKLDSVTAVDRGLRDGLLLDLLRKLRNGEEDRSLAMAAEALGQRFYYDESHARQVAKIALSLFDDLAPLHQLPAASRPYLEAAALLHDIGNAVSYERHHKHTYYLIRHADIPGLADRERELVACIARYHRRSHPEPTHVGMEGLMPDERRRVRKLATLLRVADSLDRSHHQPIRDVKAQSRAGRVHLTLFAKTPVDLELWDVEHELMLFRRVFGQGLQIEVKEP